MTHYGPEPLPPTPMSLAEIGRRYWDAIDANDAATARRWCDEYVRAGGKLSTAPLDLTPTETDYPPHDPDADPCRCVDCSERAWDRLQEAQAAEPSEWNQAYKGRRE